MQRASLIIKKESNMKAKELRKALEKAKNGNDDARRELEFYTRNWSVFVLDNGELDVDATAGAIQYRLKADCDPDEWNDLPTCTFDKAFAESQQLNPLTLRPVTPGTWEKLWKLPNGRRLAAIIYYGRAQGHIIMGDLEIRDKVRDLLSGASWGLLESVKGYFDADEDGRSAALAAVVGKRSPLLQAPMAVERLGGRENDPYSTRHLLDMLVAGFGLQEIRTLCFDIGVDHENLRGEGKTAKARELVLWAQRYDKTELLIDAARQRNPSRFRIHFGAS